MPPLAYPTDYFFIFAEINMFMNHDIQFSIIITVYNRPDEVGEFLKSLTLQTYKEFEVLVVEDSLSSPCESVCQEFSNRLSIRYFFVPPSGRSEKRNYAMEHANGNFFIIFDTDCIIPPSYIDTVKKELTDNYADCYGGPDSAEDSFTDLQKAINFSMTSFMTTGGIRGGAGKPEKFHPRSFNMGMSKDVFEKVGGFRNMIGEDIDMSIRIKKGGFKTLLYKDAFVFHKRKISLKKFYWQVNTFGKARILLSKLHPGSLKAVHLLPTIFVLGHILLLLMALILLSPLFLMPIGIYIIAIFIESLIKNRKIKIALLSIATSYIQLFGYGLGFLGEYITGKASKATQEELYK